MIRMNVWAEGFSLRGCQHSGSEALSAEFRLFGESVESDTNWMTHGARLPELKEHWGLMVFPLPSTFQYAYGGRGGPVMLG
jgi:hypothetical protein